MRLAAPARRVETRRGTASLAGLSAALARGGAHDLAVVLDAPLAPVERLLAVEHTAPAVVWKDGSDQWACLGAAREVVLRGPCGPNDRERVRLLTEGVAVEDISGCFVYDVRVFGGLAFDATLPVVPPWERHERGRFVLPRWSYVRDETNAWLIVVATAETRRDAEARELLIAETARLLDHLADPPPRDPPGTLRDVTDAADPAWLRRVEAAIASVRAGRARKIVTSRVRPMEAARAPNVESIVSRLVIEQSNCLIYAFRFGDTTLVGATPENLVERNGLHVRSEALAGTAPVGREAWLAASAKDREEHALVVRDVAMRLASCCERVTCPPGPTTRRLRDVVHLHTPIEGALNAETHVLDVVARLHPTPAVAGAPRDEAIRWIAAEEGSARGWYAGPIGWCDGSGNGRFAVALRAAVVRGRNVWTFAGAGIVEASEPTRELAEVRLKERAMLRAFGGLG